MMPSTSWLSLKRTRTRTRFSIRRFRKFTSSKVCSGALAWLTFPATDEVGTRSGILKSIISRARGGPQIGTRHLHANRVKGGRIGRQIVRIISNVVLPAQVAQNIGEGLIERRA